jgi:apolipoprotein N-acyltransferase
VCSVDNGGLPIARRQGLGPNSTRALAHLLGARLAYACRVPARLLLALCSGLALWLAFPSVDAWPLAVVGTAGLALAATGAGAWRGAVVGLVTGLGCFVPLLSWSGIYVGWLPWVALATLQASYVAALGLVLGLTTARGSPADVAVRPVVVALGWVACELARSTTPFGGFAWGRLAYSQADAPVLGVAALLGAPGVTFLVALAGGLLALGTQHLLAVGGSWRRGVAALTAAVVVLGAPLLVPRPVQGEPLAVAGIQGNVPEMTLEFNAQRREVLDRHARTTHEAARLAREGRIPAPDLVLWPENSSDIDPLRNEDAAAVIEAAVEDAGVPVVVGAVLRGPGPDHVSNAALLYLPGEGVVDRYVKQRPVPFAEYIPYRDFFRFFSDKVDLVSRDFHPGSEVGLLSVPLAGGDLPLGVAICFEVVMDDVMRDSVLAGAEVVFVPTNNATFGLTDESVQQLAVSRVKAVELGRSLVHISTVGVSGLVLPDGSVREQTELFTQAVVAGEVPRRTELTWAVRLGPWPEWLAAAALAAVLVVPVLRRGRVRVSPAPTAVTREDQP